MWSQVFLSDLAKEHKQTKNGVSTEESKYDTRFQPNSRNYWEIFAVLTAPLTKPQLLTVCSKSFQTVNNWQLTHDFNVIPLNILVHLQILTWQCLTIQSVAPSATVAVIAMSNCAPPPPRPIKPTCLGIRVDLGDWKRYQSKCRPHIPIRFFHTHRSTLLRLATINNAADQQIDRIRPLTLYNRWPKQSIDQINQNPWRPGVVGGTLRDASTVMVAHRHRSSAMRSNDDWHQRACPLLYVVLPRFTHSTFATRSSHGAL